MLFFVLLTVFGLIFIPSILLKFYLVHSCRTCNNKVCLNGKTVIVTGANTGIGFQSALEFAKRGAKVILACRDDAKAQNARLEIIKHTENQNVYVKLVDFASLESVRNFVKEIENEEEKVDILVNNAGAAGLKQKTSPDDLQVLVQVNYFGPVLLTLLLIDLLKKAPKSRIINVSSYLAVLGHLDPNNLNRYRGMVQCYSDTKLGNILFTKQLAKKLYGSNVTTYSLHPGTIDSEVYRRLSGIRKWFIENVAIHFFKTTEEGAQTTIYTATEQNIEIYSGRHFEECAIVADYISAKSDKLAEDVWKKTVEILNIKPTI